MRFAFILSCWVIVTSFLFSPPKNRVVFGVRVAMGPNSEITSFVGYRYTPDGVLREKKIFRRDDFIRVLSGFWPSNFNPERINYFEKEKIEGGMIINDVTNEKVPYCPVFDSLWKLRFSEYPFRSVDESGWSQGMYKPSLNQERYLSNRYHIRQLDLDYFIDTNFWVLLRDMSDPKWVANYRAIP